MPQKAILDASEVEKIRKARQAMIEQQQQFQSIVEGSKAVPNLSKAPEEGSPIEELGKLVGRNIIYLRECENLSISDVAEHLGVSVHTVAGWEYGRSVPKLENLVALSRLFFVDVARLFEAR
jgi:DNA-binding transcriptional regulator YiaG